MKKRYDNKQSVESLTVGQLVVSIKPSQLRSVIGVSVTILVFVFYCGYRISQHSDELDMKTHLIKDAEDHKNFQEQLNGLEEEKRTLKKSHQCSEENQDFYQQGELQIIELPRKQRVLIKVSPKKVNY